MRRCMRSARISSYVLTAGMHASPTCVQAYAHTYRPAQRNDLRVIPCVAGASMIPLTNLSRKGAHVCVCLGFRVQGFGVEFRV